MLRNERAPTPPYDNTTTAYSILISLKKKLNWNHVIFFFFPPAYDKNKTEYSTMETAAFKLED